MFRSATRLLKLLIGVPLVCAGIGLGAVCWIGLRPETGVLVGSTLLQVIGLFSALYGIADNRVRVGGGEPLRVLLARRMRRVFRRSDKTYRLEATSDAGVVVLGEDIVGIRRPGPNTPLDRRVEMLEERLDAYGQRLKKTDRELRDQLRTLASEGSEARHELRKRVDALETRVELLVTDGAGLEALGLWWVALGVVSQGVAALLFS